MQKIFYIFIFCLINVQSRLAQASGFTTSLKAAADETGHSKAGSFQDANSLSTGVGTIISAALSFVGILFFVLIIYGGIIWMMARGNEQEVKKAQDILKMAIIGLIIVFAAYAISNFVIDTLN